MSSLADVRATAIAVCTAMLELKHRKAFECSTAQCDSRGVTASTSCEVVRSYAGAATDAGAAIICEPVCYKDKSGHVPRLATMQANCHKETLHPHRAQRTHAKQ